MIRWTNEGIYSTDERQLDGWANGMFGIFEIACRCNTRKYKDGTTQYMIYLSVPSADSKEIITLAKVRGHLADAKAVAEYIFKDFPNEDKRCWSASKDIKEE